jgi:hypothetical protein
MAHNFLGSHSHRWPLLLALLGLSHLSEPTSSKRFWLKPALHFPERLKGVQLMQGMAANSEQKQFQLHSSALGGLVPGQNRLFLRGGQEESTTFTIDTPTCTFEVTRPAKKTIGPQVPWTTRVEGWIDKAWAGNANASQLNAALLEIGEGMAQVKIPS